MMDPREMPEGVAVRVAKLEERVAELERVVREMLDGIGGKSSDFEQFQWFARRLLREMRRP